MTKLLVRKNIRLKNYDYSTEGGYFVTICTKNKEHYFGKIENGEMILNELGEICKNELQITIQKYNKTVDLHEYIIMPNHIHLLLIIADNTKTKYEHITLGNIIGARKSATSRNINQNNIPFARQSRFYEHIIRNQQEYDRIKYYIQTNPENREKDCEYEG